MLQSSGWRLIGNVSPLGRRVIASLFVLSFAAAVCAPMFWFGAANGHSIDINLIWSQNFSAQLAQGDLYPRWLSNMSRGAGSPVFFFYAPLPFYIEAVPTLLFPNLKPAIQLAWGEWLLISLSGITFFFSAVQRFGTRVALLGSALYMILPYHFEIDLWRRQDLGELAVYIWMPLVLHFTDRLIASGTTIVGLAISYSLMLVSHLPSTFLFSICLGVYVLALTPIERLPERLGRFAIALGLGIALAAVYWMPALFTEHYVHMDVLWSQYYDFHRWLWPIGHRFDNDPVHLKFAMQLFTGIGVSSLTFIVCWLSSRRRPATESTRSAVALLLFCGTAWFLMSVASTALWENFPELPKVQFPWRVACVVDLAAAIAALYAANRMWRQRDLYSAGAVLLSVGLLISSLVGSDLKTLLEPFTDPKFIAERDFYVQHHVDTLEYQTVWNPSTDQADSSRAIGTRDEISFDSSSGSLDLIRWQPHVIELDTRLSKPAVVSVRQYYYPNWRATLETGETVLVTASPKSGLIDVQVPAGNHRVSLRQFRQPEEIVGAILSTVCATGLLLWQLRPFHIKGAMLRPDPQ